MTTLQWNPPQAARPAKPRNCCEFCNFETTPYRTERNEIVALLSKAELNQYKQNKYTLAQIIDNRRIKYQRALKKGI